MDECVFEEIQMQRSNLMKMLEKLSKLGSIMLLYVRWDLGWININKMAHQQNIQFFLKNKNKTFIFQTLKI